MNRLPSSPSRTQALVEFEAALHDAFQHAAPTIDEEALDVLHYLVFRVQDRFCASAAWLVAPRLGIDLNRLALPLSAVEISRCATLFRTHPTRSHSVGRGHEKFIETALVEAAGSGLVPLSFQLAMKAENTELKLALTQILSEIASPMRVLSATYREKKTSTWSELRQNHQEKATPAFEASGAVLELLSNRTGIKDWFQKLGLFAHWVDELTTNGTISPSSSQPLMTMSETMDVIKSLEAELLDKAKHLGLVGASHELIEPLADLLKNRLQ